MTEAPVLIDIDDNGTAWLTLNRPEKHNAFDDDLIGKLADAARSLDANDKVRSVVLNSRGKSFSAGADLNWMRRMADYTHQENLDDATALAEMLRALDRLSKPLIASVQGAAFGGGCGLIACCDIVIAADTATFSLSEVKLGIIPSVISPYVVGAMGARQARRYLLTAERFSAEEALRIGLVHQVVAPEALKEAVETMIDTLHKNGPNALSECKDLIRAVAWRVPDDDVVRDTAERIARVRASAEGKEGISAFLEKRKPNWIQD